MTAAGIIFLIIILVLAVWLLMNGIFYGLVFRRAENREPDTELSMDDPDMVRYPFRTFSFSCGQNLLAAWFFGKEDPKGLVVIAHGIYGRAESHLAEMKFFADRGWQVILFDGTGAARSGGRNLKGLAQRRFDLEALLDDLNRRPEFAGVPVCVYGHSMGAYAAAAALKTHHKRIRSAVCISGFCVPLEELMYAVKTRSALLAALMRPFAAFWNRVSVGPEAGMSALEGLNASDTPVFLVHGSEDEAVPAESVGLIAYREQIRNPNVRYLLCTQRDRNGHTSVQLSERAAAYARQKEDELRRMHARYGRKMPAEAAAAFANGTDRQLLHETDPEFMRRIERFFLNGDPGESDG